MAKTNPELYTALGRAMDEILSERCLSQREVGRRMACQGFERNCPHNALNNMMRGTTGTNFDIISKFALAVGLTTAEENKLWRAAIMQTREQSHRLDRQ